MKFGRYYEVSITVGSQTIVFKPPMNISFALDKSCAGGLNRLTMDIYNPSDKHRLALVKDAEQIKPMTVEFKAGYADDFGTLFVGSVFRAQAKRVGPNLITRIESLDGWYDLANADVSVTVDNPDAAIDAILGGLTTVTRGKITSRPSLSSPKVLVGSALKVLRDCIGPDEKVFIDNGQLFIVQNDETLSSFVPLVSAKTGLMNTPIRQQKKISFETMLNPAIRMQCMFEMESVVMPHLNGQYMCQSLHYTGEYDGRDWKQSVVGLASPEYKEL